MKKVITVITLSLLCISCRGQFSITTDTNGVLKVALNGRSTNFFQTNISFFIAALTNDATIRAWFLNASTQAQSKANLTLTNSLLQKSFADTFTATNFSAPKSGFPGSQSVGGGTASTNGVQVGVGDLQDSTGATAIGNNYAAADSPNSTLVGANNVFSGATNSIAIGRSNTITHPNSVTIANGGASLGDNLWSFGNQDSSGSNYLWGLTIFEDFDTPLGSIGAANVGKFDGTNQFVGPVSFTVTNAGGYSGGDVLLDLGIANTTHVISGNSSTINICGIKYGYNGRHISIIKTNQYNIVLRNLSSAAGTSATEKIFTGTGGDVTLTNFQLKIDFDYEPTLGGWILNLPR
jgi:hypothetical protein